MTPIRAALWRINITKIYEYMIPICAAIQLAKLTKILYFIIFILYLLYGQTCAAIWRVKLN